jgi:hypothetical protein
VRSELRLNLGDQFRQARLPGDTAKYFKPSVDLLTAW